MNMIYNIVHCTRYTYTHNILHFKLSFRAYSSDLVKLFFTDDDFRFQFLISTSLIRQHGNTDITINSFSLFTCKLVIWIKLARNQNLKRKVVLSDPQRSIPKENRIYIRVEFRQSIGDMCDMWVQSVQIM